MAPTKEPLTSQQMKDRVINVTLSEEDYAVMRDMIEKQKGLNWLGKWVRSVAIVTIGGLVSLFLLGEHLKDFIDWLIKSLSP